eukprot:7251695-Pyramimonas_sp.AAC.1
MGAAVRSCMEQLACASLADDSWAQAQLKLNRRGPGLRSAEKHSPAAYLSSRAKRSELCRSMRAGHADDDAGDAGALTTALQAHNASAAEAGRAARFDAETHSNQKALSDKVDDASRAALWNRSSLDARPPRPGGCARRRRAPAGV